MARRATDEKGVEGQDKRPLTTERRGDDKRPLTNRRAQVSSLDTNHTKAAAAESSVRKEADKLAAAVEAAAEEVKPVAEAAPKKKKGFSPFKGFGKKKEA